MDKDIVQILVTYAIAAILYIVAYVFAIRYLFIGTVIWGQILCLIAIIFMSVKIGMWIGWAQAMWEALQAQDEEEEL